MIISSNWSTECRAESLTNGVLDFNKKIFDLGQHIVIRITKWNNHFELTIYFLEFLFFKNSPPGRIMSQFSEKRKNNLIITFLCEPKNYTKRNAKNTGTVFKIFVENQSEFLRILLGSFFAWGCFVSLKLWLKSRYYNGCFFFRLRNTQIFILWNTGLVSRFWINQKVLTPN